MKYDVTVNFKRKFDRKDQKARERIEKTIRLLVENTRYPSLRTHKVKNTRHIFEAYVDDSSRLTFQYGDEGLILRNNCTHEAVLQRP